MLEKCELLILRQASRETRALDSASWYYNNVETQVSALRLGLCSDVEKWISTLASWCLQWCWDAGFNPRVLVLRWWRWLTLHLEFEFCFLTTCLQWFLDSLQVALHFASNASLWALHSHLDATQRSLWALRLTTKRGQCPTWDLCFYCNCKSPRGGWIGDVLV